MDTTTVILIGTNIVTPIVVALITGVAQSKKYKKEIELLNVQHENKISEITKDFEHKLEMEELKHKQQQELETQKVGNEIIKSLTDKVGDVILQQPSTQKIINQKTQRAFLRKKKK